MRMPTTVGGAPARRALPLLVLLVLASLTVAGLLLSRGCERSAPLPPWEGVYATADASTVLYVRPDGRVTVVSPEGSEVGLAASEASDCLLVEGTGGGRLEGPALDGAYRYRPRTSPEAALPLVRVR